MADLDLVRRVEKLEESVDSLRDLPERTTRLEVRMGNVEMQIVHLRDKIHSGVSAMQDDVTATKVQLRGESSAVRAEQEEMAAQRAMLRIAMADLKRDLSATLLLVGNRILAQLEDLRRVIEATRRGNPPAN